MLIQKLFDHDPAHLNFTNFQITNDKIIKFHYLHKPKPLQCTVVKVAFINKCDSFSLWTMLFHLTFKFGWSFVVMGHVHCWSFSHEPFSFSVCPPLMKMHTHLCMYINMCIYIYINIHTGIYVFSKVKSYHRSVLVILIFDHTGIA